MLCLRYIVQYILLRSYSFGACRTTSMKKMMMIQGERPPRASAPPRPSCTQRGWAAPLSRCALPRPLHSDRPPRYGTQTLHMPYTLSNACSRCNSPRWPFVNMSSSICLLLCVCVCVCKARRQKACQTFSSSSSTGVNPETEIAVAIRMLLHPQGLLILQKPFRQA